MDSLPTLKDISEQCFSFNLFIDSSIPQSEIIHHILLASRLLAQLPQYSASTSEKKALSNIIIHLISLKKHPESTVSRAALQCLDALEDITNGFLFSHCAPIILSTFIKDHFCSRSSSVLTPTSNSNLRSPFSQQRFQQTKMADSLHNFDNPSWKRPHVLQVLEYIVLQHSDFDQDWLAWLNPPLCSLIEDYEVKHRLLGLTLLNHVLSSRIQLSAFSKMNLHPLWLEKLTNCFFFCYGQGSENLGLQLFNQLLPAIQSLLSLQSLPNSEHNLKIMHLLLQTLSYIGFTGGEKNDSFVRRESIHWLCIWAKNTGLNAVVYLKDLLQVLLENLSFEANLYLENKSFSKQSMVAAEGNKIAILSIVNDLQIMMQIFPQRMVVYYPYIIQQFFSIISLFISSNIPQEQNNFEKDFLEELKGCFILLGSFAPHRFRSDINLLGMNPQLSTPLRNFFNSIQSICHQKV